MAVGAGGNLPHLVVSGAPFERARQYGALAADRIRLSIENYKQVFHRHAGLDWAGAVDRAQRYEKPIAEFFPQAIEEMKGIAAGAGLPYAEILALNSRSELMFAGGDTAMVPDPGECSSFALLPESTASGHTLIGQNWDWLEFSRDTMVLLEVHRDDGPNYLTVVEAGLLAKTGVNAVGIGLCTNTLVSTVDRGEAGVPYHIVLRKLLDSMSINDAAQTIYTPHRSLSANYLVAASCGLAFDAETLPGGGEAVRVMMPDDDLLVHANHFVDPDFAKVDARVRISPSTLFRADVLRRLLRRHGRGVTIEHAMEALRDERNYPAGVNAHPDPERHPMERWCTVASVIMDLDAGEIHIADGAPSERAYRRYDFNALLRDPPANAPETLVAAT